MAPLDWGLGHITRCIPIINFLLDTGCRVILAANGPHARLLEHEFPDLELLKIPDYRLSYGASSKATKWKFFFQLPKILTAIKRENQWLAMKMAERKFDMVISDCRFGLHHPDVFCVLMTHQLHIKSPFGKWTERVLQKFNYRFIDQFNECWVPDFESSNNFAGDLSHPSLLPNVPVKYIGGLSRFNEKMCNANTQKYDLLVILSGPEPQRSILENILQRELASFKGRAAIVRGLPDQSNTISSSNITLFNHLPAADLCTLIMNSELIISRSGYTTVMDLVRLRKKSILIPTPGQTEQEYLGQYLMQKKLCVCIHQHKFSLEPALQQAAAFEYADMSLFDMEQYKTVISQSSSIFAS